MSDEMRKNLAGLLDEMESTTAEHRELNTSNYGHDDVCQLNNWGIGACELMERVILASRAQATPAAVPDGWKLVPIKPTKEMRQACRVAGKIQVWDDMLAASPDAPPAAEQPDTVPVPRDLAEGIDTAVRQSDWPAAREAVEELGALLGKEAV